MKKGLLAAAICGVIAVSGTASHANALGLGFTTAGVLQGSYTAEMFQINLRGHYNSTKPDVGVATLKSGYGVQALYRHGLGGNLTCLAGADYSISTEGATKDSSIGLVTGLEKSFGNFALTATHRVYTATTDPSKSITLSFPGTVEIGVRYTL